jgi:hypothetical protein
MSQPIRQESAGECSAFMQSADFSPQQSPTGRRILHGKNPAQSGRKSLLTRLLEVVLPNAQHLPSKFAECSTNQKVTRFVGLELLPPELFVLLRPGSMLRAAMPETPVHKHHHPLPPEDKIRPHFSPRTNNRKL